FILGRRSVMAPGLDWAFPCARKLRSGIPRATWENTDGAAPLQHIIGSPIRADGQVTKSCPSQFSSFSKLGLRLSAGEIHFARLIRACHFYRFGPIASARQSPVTHLVLALGSR